MLRIQVRDVGNAYDGQRGIILLVKGSLVVVALDSGEVRAFPELKLLPDETHWPEGEPQSG